MADNKYSVNAKLIDLASRLTALEAENKALRTHLWGALETKANDLKHVIQDSIRVPVDGKTGAMVLTEQPDLKAARATVVMS
jgi:hypothetical protein